MSFTCGTRPSKPNALVNSFPDRLRDDAEEDRGGGNQQHGQAEAGGQGSRGDVYEFVAGDGEKFDFGYNFQECADQKFNLAQNGDEFTLIVPAQPCPEEGRIRRRILPEHT
jgi:hypothetical protein